MLGATVIGGPGPAGAHAALVGTDPEDGSTLSALPAEIAFEFNEPVGSSSEVAVTAPDGTPVEVVDVAAVDREVTASVGAATLRGDYVIAYRVVSADGHPVSGQLAVTVTEGAEPETTAAAPQAQESFVHRHREHLLWGALVAVVAVALIVAPLLRRRRP